MKFTRKKLNEKLDIQIIKEAGISLYSEDEIYVKIKEFNDYYISNYGHVISTKRGKITLLTPNREDEDLIHKKYYCIGITNNNGEPKNPKIHTLVATAFCVKPRLGEKMEVHHINTYSYNQKNEECNRADNLVFVTKKFHSILDAIEKIGVVRNNSIESFTYYKNPYMAFKAMK
jgi:hypothetical protein